jgi:hypothetical protein
MDGAKLIERIRLKNILSFGSVEAGKRVSRAVFWPTLYLEPAR